MHGAAPVGAALALGALADELGITVKPIGTPAEEGEGGTPQGSTDMGNLSAVIPSIHPTIGYDVAGGPHHSAEFAQQGTSSSADQAVLDEAVALAWTGASVAIDPQTRRLLTPTGRP